jgi:hypothetical protein
MFFLLYEIPFPLFLAGETPINAKINVQETGSLTLPPIPATSSEILQNMKMDEACKENVKTTWWLDRHRVFYRENREAIEDCCFQSLYPYTYYIKKNCGGIPFNVHDMNVGPSPN